MEGNEPQLKPSPADSKPCPLTRERWLWEAQGLVPYTRSYVGFEPAPPRQGRPQAALGDLNNLHSTLGPATGGACAVSVVPLVSLPQCAQACLWG